MESQSVLLLEAGTGQPSEELEGSVSEHSEVDETLVDSIWNELEGKVGREKIRSAIMRARAKYDTARVNTFVPILVRRQVLDELRPDEEQVFGFSS